MIFCLTIPNSIELKSLSFWMSYATFYSYKIGVPTPSFNLKEDFRMYVCMFMYMHKIA